MAHISSTYDPYLSHMINQGLVVEARLRRLWRPLPLVPPVPGRGKDFEGPEGVGISCSTLMVIVPKYVGKYTSTMDS